MTRYLTFDLVVNPFILFLTAIVSVLIGIAIGKYKMAKSRSRIVQLENEMIESHGEILELQAAYIALEKKLNDQAIPVIPLKTAGGMKISSNKESSKEQASK
jgi:hypothetical protein